MSKILRQLTVEQEVTEDIGLTS